MSAPSVEVGSTSRSASSHVGGIHLVAARGRRTAAPSRPPRGTARRTPTRTSPRRRGSRCPRSPRRRARRGSRRPGRPSCRTAQRYRRRLGVHGDACEQLQRRVVHDLAVLYDAAVAVVGVLAQADVGDDEQLGKARAARGRRLCTAASSSQASEPRSSFSRGSRTAATPGRPQAPAPPPHAAVRRRCDGRVRAAARSRGAREPRTRAWRGRPRPAASHGRGHVAPASVAAFANGSRGSSRRKTTRLWLVLRAGVC